MSCVGWPRYNYLCISGVRVRAAPSETEAMPMDTILEVLQALALVASITQSALGIAREVREMAREHKHGNG
jgi:adenylosuccinate lyase